MIRMKLMVEIPDNYDLSNIQSGSIASKVILNAVKNSIPIPDNVITYIEEYMNEMQATELLAEARACAESEEV